MRNLLLQSGAKLISDMIGYQAVYQTLVRVEDEGLPSSSTMNGELYAKSNCEFFQLAAASLQAHSPLM